MASSTASRKAKGRIFQQYICRKLLETFPELHTSDVVSRSMGSPGSDVMLSKAATDAIGDYDIECKAQESLNIWDALKQADTRSGNKLPIVAFKRNRSPVYVAMDLEIWLNLLDDIRVMRKIIKGDN